jgi:hypothetical protein
MKSFIEYISEQETIVPAVSRIPEPLPFGFSIKGDPVGKKKQDKPDKPKQSQQSQSKQSLTFAERLRLAKERANIQK